MRQSTQLARAVPVPNVQQVIDLQASIARLRTRQDDLLATIVSDCVFMDVPVLRLRDFELSNHQDSARGDVFHVLNVEREWALAQSGVEAHLAATCDHPGCAPVGDRIKFPKSSHKGRETFYTRLLDHVLVGSESIFEPRLHGFRLHFTLVPLSTNRRAA